MSEIDDLRKLVTDLSSKLEKLSADKEPKEWPAGLKEKYSKLLSEKSAPQSE